MYIEHPDGNQWLYGLNTFRCESTIRFKGEIWKFDAFVVGDTKKAIYVNVDGSGKSVVIDVYDNTLEITRMKWVNN